MHTIPSLGIRRANPREITINDMGKKKKEKKKNDRTSPKKTLIADLCFLYIAIL